jgi:hypothetical protein
METPTAEGSRSDAVFNGEIASPWAQRSMDALTEMTIRRTILSQ